VNKRIEDLKQKYPQLWERACKEFSVTKAREKYFLALIEIQKAKLAEQVEREKIRKRRTRSLILFASSLIRKCPSEQLKELVELVQDEMQAREGGTATRLLAFFAS